MNLPDTLQFGTSIVNFFDQIIFSIPNLLITSLGTLLSGWILSRCAFNQYFLRLQKENNIKKKGYKKALIQEILNNIDIAFKPDPPPRNPLPNQNLFDYSRKYRMD